MGFQNRKSPRFRESLDSAFFGEFFCESEGRVPALEAARGGPGCMVNSHQSRTQSGVSTVGEDALHVCSDTNAL